jgi:hypothetical protein
MLGCAANQQQYSPEMTGFPAPTERHCCGMVEGRGEAKVVPPAKDAPTAKELLKRPDVGTFAGVIEFPDPAQSAGKKLRAHFGTGAKRAHVRAL